MSGKMRAMRLDSPAVIEEAPLRAVEIPIPEPGEGQVLLKVRVCGVCHTDLHIVEGELWPEAMKRVPRVPGHQVVGEVVQTGKGVTGWEIGQRVGVPWLYKTCGKCLPCLRGEENLCENAQFTGLHVDGGFAEYMLAEADFLLALPEEIGDVQAAPLLCAGIIGYRALRKAGLQPGERLGLFGFGASAHLAIQMARAWTCKVSVFTRSEGHRRLASELGAAWVGGPGDMPLQPLDRAVIFAPAGELVPLALKTLRSGGTLAINAVTMSPLPAMPYDLIYWERSLCSVANATYQDGVEFLDLASEIGLRVETVTYPLESANQALADLKHSRFNGEAVLVL